jgi:hypothetical protein
VCVRERERVRDAAELTTRYNILAQGTIRKRKRTFLIIILRVIIIIKRERIRIVLM